MRERIAMKVARFVPGRGGTSNLSFLFNLGKPYMLLKKKKDGRDPVKGINGIEGKGFSKKRMPIRN
jgi:hypothetical protein